MQDSERQEPIQLCRDAGEIFFRDTDISRFDRVFDAVVQQCQHLLLTSQFDGVIDHYGKMMLNRLKMRSGMAVETYMPASTEALVARFNELLEQMSMEEAKGETPSQAAGRIIIVNDARALESDGWALLSRMITDFPGLNMRLVFLLDRIPASVEKALDRFGSRVLRWDIEPPTAGEQLALRKQGMQTGLEFQVERVLSRINHTVSQQLEPNLDSEPPDPSMQLDVGEALGGSTAAGEREAEDMRALFEEDQKPTRSGNGLLFALLLAIVAVIGTAIAGFVTPRVGQPLDQALQALGFEDTVFTRTRDSQSVVDAAYDDQISDTSPTLQLPELSEPDGAETRDTPEMPETARSDLSTAIAESASPTEEESLDPAADAAPAADPENTLPSAPATGESDGSPTEPDAVVDSEPQTETPPADPVSEEAAEVEPAEPSAPADPVRELIVNADPESQFVQHIVFTSPARAQAWLGTQPALTQAVITPILVNNRLQHAVVSGPFSVRAEIQEYIQGLADNADYWVRTAGSLQRILPEEE